MSHFYIYNFTYKEKSKSTTATVIFCPGLTIDTFQLQEELKIFYSNYYQTDKTIFIAGSYIAELADIIIKDKQLIFKYVPKIEERSFYDHLHILAFNARGCLVELQQSGLKKFENIDAFSKQYLTQGLQKIFIERGGLVESTGSHHHYVFPSGKHSDKFLRVANILLYSSEIYFIAFGLLKYFDTEKYKVIYCDTSSINSIAIALNELLNRFLDNKIAYSINSFKSYEGIYDSSLHLKSTSFVLISASTSGGLVSYLRKQHKELKKDNIVVLFFLENRKPNNETLDQVLCNLTKSETNKHGVETFDTLEADGCRLCKASSFPVKVSGDVFLLEQPKVNNVRINADDMDVVTSSKFINQFMSFKGGASVLKTNYKETGENAFKKYEIYIDYSYIIDNIEDDRFKKYKKKLNAYINQYVPSNIKCILYLNDASSKKLAVYIRNKILDNYTKDKQPSLKNQDQFEEINKDIAGSILIVGSCITNGKNLLYLSRALRNYNLRIVYFIGITRPYNEDTYKFLKSNLKYGAYGSENSTFIEVEKIYCSNLSYDNPWQVEVDFLKGYLSVIDDSRVVKFLRERIKTIEDCYSNQIRGMSSNLFLPRIEKTKKKKELKIRRNSAFFNRENYANHVSQSDVYFNISYVINKLRTSNNGHTLKQSAFVRNLISPENLNRFNDGIIQASILRCAKKEELKYSINADLSKQVKDILITIFKYRYQEQGEALLEFLYALATKKMTLKKEHVVQLLSELEDENNYIINFYKNIVRENVNN